MSADSADAPTPPTTDSPGSPHSPGSPAPSAASDPSAPSEFVRLLRAQRVWDTELPDFAPAAAPAGPLPLFEQWFAEAVAAGQVEPHTMSLATADAEGLPDVRTVMLHGADQEGWHFASHAGSRKGRHLAARPYAALGFYWPAQGRQIRVRGPVTVAPPEVARADLHARSTGALASALVGRQSEVLHSYEELERASDAAWDRARREPDASAPSWTVYVLAPDEVEFFQGDARRRHVRLTYRRREDGTWRKDLLWP
ncbi:pyridoxal 5'-phosphate synthase [Streptomyces sp. BH-SS-21]|uniref:Pyridoxal 5'-phosphate synthase n=1 Tax=Streptomyces liliiviolaceus TaxID=2823109 RepID=A0A940XNR7_9ACTN|nr:pyridoxal 5'-phosphate synthase [Streptomyces liliiviolaceus]MBQ0847310.1 pyridoxal 5'-phosphate synthase [Streptomyces liliiviolaceus]